MQIVIDISEEEYKCVQITGHIGNATAVSNAIFNGISLPKGHWINAEQKVTAQLYDDEYEEFIEKEMTIAKFLDRYTNEGCPVSIIETDKENEE